MLEEIKNIKSEKNDIRNFGLIIGAVLIVIVMLLFWKKKQSYDILMIVGVVLCVTSLILPVILKPFYFAWMTFAVILGWFMTRVILSLVFYGIITPTGLFSRLVGKEFLNLKLNKTENTYWNHRRKHSLKKRIIKNNFNILIR